MADRRHIALLFIAGLLLFNNYFTDSVPFDTDGKSHLVQSWHYAEYIGRYHAIPQWIDFWYAGFPVSINVIFPYLIVGLLAAIFKFVSVAFWYKAVFALSVIASSVLIYLIAEKYGISEKAALAGALLFLVNPRVLYNMGGWGQYPTFFALVPLLLMVYFIKSQKAWLAAIFFAATLLSHLETSLIAAYFLFANFAYEFLGKRYRNIAVPVSVLVFGFLLASFWLIPTASHILFGGVQNLEGIRKPLSPLSLMFFWTSEAWPGIGVVLFPLGLLGLALSFRNEKMRDLGIFSLILLFVGTTIGFVLLNNGLTAFAFKFLFNHPMPERHILFLAVPFSILSAYAIDTLMKGRLRLNIGGNEISSKHILLAVAVLAFAGSAWYLSITYASLTDSFVLSGGQKEVVDYFKGKDAMVFVGEGFNAAGEFDKFFPMYTKSRVLQGFSPELTLNFPYINALYSKDYVQLAYYGGAEYFVINKNGTRTMVPYYDIFLEVLKGSSGEFAKVLENSEYVVYEVKDPVRFVSGNVQVSYERPRPEELRLGISNCTGQYNLTILQTFSPEWHASKGELGRTPLFFTYLVGKCEGSGEQVILEYRHRYYYWVTALGAVLFALYFGYADKRLLGPDRQVAYINIKNT